MPPLRTLLIRLLGLSMSLLTALSFPWAVLTTIADWNDLPATLRSLRSIGDLPPTQLAMTAIGLGGIVLWAYLQRFAPTGPGGASAWSPHATIAVLYAREIVEAHQRLSDTAPLRPVRFRMSVEPSKVLETTDGTELLDQARHLVLLGEAGSGKSTALRALAHSCAMRSLALLEGSGPQGTSAAGPTVPVPLTVDLSRLIRSIDSLLLRQRLGRATSTDDRAIFLQAVAEQISTVARVDGLDGALPRWILEGNVAWLLDDLESVPFSRRAELFELLHTQVVGRSHQSAIVLCCRPETAAELGTTQQQVLTQFTRAFAQPLSDDDLQRWLRADEHTSLRSLLTRDPALDALARNPFSLSVLMRLPPTKLEVLSHHEDALEVRDALLEAYVAHIAQVSGYSHSQLNRWLGHIARRTVGTGWFAADFTRLPALDRPDPLLALIVILSASIVSLATAYVSHGSPLALGLSFIVALFVSALVSLGPMLWYLMLSTGFVAHFVSFNNRASVMLTEVRLDTARTLRRPWSVWRSAKSVFDTTGFVVLIVGLLTIPGTIYLDARSQLGSDRAAAATVFASLCLMFAVPSVLQTRVALARLAGLTAIAVAVWLRAPWPLQTLIVVGALWLARREAVGLIVFAAASLLGIPIARWLNAYTVDGPQLALVLSVTPAALVALHPSWITRSSSAAVCLALVAAGVAVTTSRFGAFAALVASLLANVSLLPPVLWSGMWLPRIWERWGHSIMVSPLAHAILSLTLAAPIRQAPFFGVAVRHRLLFGRGQHASWSHLIWREHFLRLAVLGSRTGFDNAARYVVHGQHVLMEALKGANPDRRSKALLAIPKVFGKRGVKDPAATARTLLELARHDVSTCQQVLVCMRSLVGTLIDGPMTRSFVTVSAVLDAALVAQQCDDNEALRGFLATGLPVAEHWLSDPSRLDALERLVTHGTLGERLPDSPRRTLSGIFELAAAEASARGDTAAEARLRDNARVALSVAPASVG